MKKTLHSKIKSLASKLDLADIKIVGVEGYKQIKGGLHPKELLPEAKSAIVYLYPYNKLIKKYGNWYIVSLNKFISLTNKKFEKLLSKEEIKTRGVQENEYDRKTLIGKISFRQLAVIAGLGSIGKNQMLLHKKLGPRCVIGVILTDAKVKQSIFQKKDLCANCKVCREMCPTKALDHNYDKWKCKKRRKILGKGCGIPCVELCPIGEK